jgi:hypothetical protein
MTKPSWQRMGRVFGHDAARTAIPVYVCSRPGCEVHHPAVKVGGKWTAPGSCIKCHGMAFDRFPSTAEANRWASLRMLEKRGVITNLRRQVRFPLMTIAPNGLQVHVADYIADHVYFRDGKEIVEDVKPRFGMDPVAALKLRWMAAQRGDEVLIYTT